MTYLEKLVIKLMDAADAIPEQEITDPATEAEQHYFDTFNELRDAAEILKGNHYEKN